MRGSRIATWAAVWTALSFLATAMWESVPLETLVQESDLVVAATLKDVKEKSVGGTDRGEGCLEIHEVLLGEARPGDRLTLRWQNPTGLACPRVEHAQLEGQKGIWLLTRVAEAGEVKADYPGRFVPLSEKDAVEALVRKLKATREGAKRLPKDGAAGERPACPGCGSAQEVVPIEYGKGSANQIEKHRRGEILLRGCAVASERWHCKACKKSW